MKKYDRINYHSAFTDAVAFVLQYLGIDAIVYEEETLRLGKVRADIHILIKSPALPQNGFFRTDTRHMAIEYKSSYEPLVRFHLTKLIYYADQISARIIDKPQEGGIVTSLLVGYRFSRHFDAELPPGFELEKQENGIYHISGYSLHPLRIVNVPELEGEEYTAFQLITKDPAYDKLLTFMEQYEGMAQSGLLSFYHISSIIEFLNKTNPDLIERYNNEKKGDKAYMNTLGMLVGLMSESKEALYARDIRIFNQDKTISRKDAVIRQQKARIENQNTELIDKQATIDHQNATINDQNAMINNQTATINDQKSVIFEQSEMLTLMGSTISAWKKLASFLTADALQAAAKSAGVNLRTLL